MDRKIIWMIILFVIFICGFIFAAISYGQKKQFETNDGREDRRESEDEQKDYENAVHRYFIGIIIGVVSFIIFFELSRYHWIEIGKKLARFEWLHDNEIKKKAIEEVRIQTVVQSDDEPKPAPKVTMKERIKSLKMKKDVKTLPSGNVEQTETSGITTEPVTIQKSMSNAAIEAPIQDNNILLDEVDSIGEDEEHYYSLNEVESSTPDIASPEPIQAHGEFPQDDGMKENESADVRGNGLIEEKETRITENGPTIADEPKAERFDDGDVMDERRRITEEEFGFENEMCPNCQGVGVHQGFGNFKCLECGYVWMD